MLWCTSSLCSLTACLVLGTLHITYILFCVLSAFAPALPESLCNHQGCPNLQSLNCRARALCTSLSDKQTANLSRSIVVRHYSFHDDLRLFALDWWSWMLTHSDNDLSPVRCQWGKHKRHGFQDDTQKRLCGPVSWNDVGHFVWVFQRVC